MYDILGSDEEDLAEGLFERLDDSDADEDDIEDNGDTEEDDDNFDDIENLDVDNEFEFYDYEDYVEWQNEISYRQTMLQKIELLIARMHDLYAEFLRIRMLFYVRLTDYCERTRLFLRRYERLRRSRKLRRAKGDSMNNVDCKYNILEQLLAHIDEVHFRLLVG